MFSLEPRVTGRRLPVTWPVPVDPSGRAGPTDGCARGARWRRTSRGLDVPTDVDGRVPEQRVVEAAGRLPDGGAVTGWAALRWRGLRVLDGRHGRDELPVRLLAGPGRGRRAAPGVAWSYDRVEEVAVADGLPVVSPERAVFDEARHAAGVREALVALDMALAGRLVERAALTSYVGGRAGWDGVRQVRAALALADCASGSPQETRLRFEWCAGLGFPAPLVNTAVFDDTGMLLGYPDLLDVAAGLAVEYDGSEHRSATRHSDDVDREALFRAAGLEVVRVTWRDLGRPAHLRWRLREARDRALARSDAARRWSLSPHSIPERRPRSALRRSGMK